MLIIENTRIPPEGDGRVGALVALASEDTSVEARVLDQRQFPAHLALLLLGAKRFRFVGVTLPRDRASEAHFGADFYSINLERIAVACYSGFPLPVWFWIITR